MFKMITSGTNFIKPEVGLIAACYTFMDQVGLQDDFRIRLQTHPVLGIVG